ncbi:MAG TPA: hypothetical protein VE172_12915 [Stackebrandtia sp.]|jgi:hypothetical protein|nr:hypothetical protein [Stackebrandtia sp.]HZE39702.1 hypothetical protein [Stackebrandtia sp.]
MSLRYRDGLEQADIVADDRGGFPKAHTLLRELKVKPPLLRQRPIPSVA